MAAAAVKKSEYKVPRSFRLRMELEVAEKGATADQKANSNKPKDPHAMWISFGLGELEDRGYDLQLCNWNGTIIGPQNTALGDRIYNLKIFCGNKYPDMLPTVHFVNKINMDGVDQKTGQVSGIMKSWSRKNTIYDYLVSIRTQMVQAAKVKQPQTHETYS